MKLYSILLLATVVPMVGNGAAKVMPPKVDPRGTRYCDKEVLHLGEIRMEANEWSDTNQTTCIFLDKDGSFGIEWKRGETGTKKADGSSVPNYPKAEFGAAPWSSDEAPAKSSTALLPIQLKDLESAGMTLDVTTVTVTNHGWNLAFELWLSDEDPTQGKARPRAELMIFLGNQPRYWPWEPKGGTFNDGNNTYTLYESSDEWHEWGYYRQWRLGDTDGTVEFKGKVDIGAFLKHHMEADGWDGNLWLTRFEIGNETYQNSGGTTRFRELTFEINGRSRTALTE